MTQVRVHVSKFYYELCRDGLNESEIMVSGIFSPFCICIKHSEYAKYAPSIYVPYRVQSLSCSGVHHSEQTPRS